MTNHADQEITITRLLHAPRELVYEAWTDPKHIGEWWGPRGFTSTVQAMNVTPGGTWTLVMKGPDGTEYPNHVEFLEVVRPERLVYIHGSEAGQTKGQFKVWVSFEEEGGNTRLTMRSRFNSKAERDFVVENFHAIEGGKQTLDRLEEFLASAEHEQFSLTRIFNAPRAAVWAAWTEKERMAAWWGPKGFTLGVAAWDLRPGGVFHYWMEGPPGSPMAGKMWGRFVFREISAPDRLVFVNAFSDEHGGITRHPMSATWPLEVFNILTMTEKEGRTTVTLRGGPINASEAERQTFLDHKASMVQGFAGTWSQLDAYLARR